MVTALSKGVSDTLSSPLFLILHGATGHRTQTAA
jgi:hypothetical protein